MRTSRSRWTAWSALSLTAAAVLGGCATDREAAPLAPNRVVVDISNESVDALAERVAAKVAAEIAKTKTVGIEVGNARRVPGAAAVEVGNARLPGAGGPAAAVPARPASPPPGVFVQPLPVDADAAVSEAAEAVQAACDWLVAHQSEDGAWHPDTFTTRCPGVPCDGRGESAYAPGVTGLALTALLRAAPTLEANPRRDAILAGLRYLRGLQDAEGCIGPRISSHFQYNHACAALALVEAQARGAAAGVPEAAQHAVEFVMRSQNPYLGWRYGVRDGDNDTSMTCWMVRVLGAARDAGIAVDDNAWRGALAWVDKMTEPEFGRVGYMRRGGPTARVTEMQERYPAELSEAMTAAGLLIREICGQSASTNPLAQRSADLIVSRPPTWDVERGTNDFYYWELGSDALRRDGGARWAAWRSALHGAVTHRQHREDSHAHGSWDALDAWSNEGGRLYATATLCLALENVVSAR